MSLGISIFIAGVINNQIFEGFKNCLFMGVAIVNSVISIIEELISKKIIDNLSLLSESKLTVLRNGKLEEISKEEVVLDDIIKLSGGHQVLCDVINQTNEIEVNESFITGESDAVTKKIGDMILSGSFIVSGTSLAKVEHIGEENYISTISKEAGYLKRSSSVISRSFEKILKFISFFIIPIGVIMFISQLKITDYNVTESLFTSVAGLIGMIPEGLILLTTSVMAVSVIRLSKYKVLVHGLHAVETLARVDVICLDKTGTLTTGEMSLKKILPYNKTKKTEIKKILEEISAVSNDENATMKSIKSSFKNKSTWTLSKIIPFSSSRKYSAYSFEKQGAYYIGAPEILLSKNKQILNDIKKYQKDYRVLVLAKSLKLTKSLKDITPLAFILIEDIIRPSASRTLNFFKKQQVDVKIISGDNLETVMSIASKCGLKNIEGLDLSLIKENELEDLIDNYNIYARVTPKQKKEIVEHLQRNGHTVAMTGDGVNDVLALKTSDCGIALSNGASCARNVSELVLLDSNFDALPKVVAEGRRTINNIERSASLLLMKTIYTVLLIIFSVISKTEYFFVPIHLTLITGVTIGIPSFILALEQNRELVEGNFLLKILSKSLPVAISVVINIMIVTLFKGVFKFSPELTRTLSVLLTTLTGFIFLIRICKPYNILRVTLITSLIIIFTYCVVYQGEFFSLVKLTKDSTIIFLMLSLCSIFVYNVLHDTSIYLFNKIYKTIK